jgi:hypothetical protein
MREGMIGLAILWSLITFVRVWFLIRHTTLVSPWAWSLVAMLAIGGDALAASLVDFQTDWPIIHYLVRILTLCPVISLLGVKRPQDGPWNFVVFALWATLAIPAAVNYVQRGGGFEVQLAWSLMSLVLVLLTFVNLLPIQPPFACAVCLGQAMLWHEYWLPKAWQHQTGMAHFGSLFLLLLSAYAPVLLKPATEQLVLDRLWLDFRNAFGSFWALRVQERMNDAAKRHDWPVELAWSGWIQRDGTLLQKPLPPEVERQILTILRGLLRRFVNHAWIEARLTSSAKPPMSNAHE